MNTVKQEALQEILKGISDMKELGLKSLSCPDISPWGLDEVSEYITTELDRLGYKLYTFHYAEDGKPTGEPSGLQIHWE